MLANAGRNDRLVFDARGEVGELFDDGLRFNETAWRLFLVGEGQTLLPVVDLAEPLRPGSFLLNMRKKMGQVSGNVAFNSFGGLDDLVDILRHNFKVTYPANPLCRCALCFRSKPG